MKRGSVSIRLNRSRLIVALSLPVLLAVALAVARAQDIEMSGADSEVLYVTNTSGGGNSAAVYGDCTNVAGNGFGGRFYGGKKGVEGWATMSGGGIRAGGRFGGANASSGENYGVYASASGSEAYAGYFIGDVYVTGSVTENGSDEKLKTDIVDLDPVDTLDQVMQLRPKSFRFRTEEYPEMNLPDEYQMGVLAQDLEIVFPEMVRQVMPPFPEGEEEGSEEDTREPFLAVNYTQLIPVLIAALQEQQWQIEELRAEVAALSRKK